MNFVRCKFSSHDFLDCIGLSYCIIWILYIFTDVARYIDIYIYIYIYMYLIGQALTLAEMAYLLHV